MEMAEFRVRMEAIIFQSGCAANELFKKLPRGRMEVQPAQSALDRFDNSSWVDGQVDRQHLVPGQSGKSFPFYDLKAAERSQMVAHQTLDAPRGATLAGVIIDMIDAETVSEWSEDDAMKGGKTSAKRKLISKLWWAKQNPDHEEWGMNPLMEWLKEESSSSTEVSPPA